MYYVIFLENCKNELDALQLYGYDLWTKERIKGGFNFHKGTIKYLQRFCDNNNAVIYTEKEFAQKYKSFIDENYNNDILQTIWR